MESGWDQILFGAAIGVVLGFLSGYLIGRRTSPGSEQLRVLEEKIESVEADKRRYQDRVTEHFSESAEKINRLTEQYREVHQHMAAGANALCNDGASGAFAALDAPAAPPEPAAIEADTVVVEPPRDYAPKASPEEPGVLNERFGLENDVPAAAEPERRDGPAAG